MFKSLFLSIVIIASSLADPASELTDLGDQYIKIKSKYFPVWATSMGIYDYDSLLTDYSSEAIFSYRNEISKINQKLRQMKTNKLGIDDYIDYRLLISNIQNDEFTLAKFPFHEHSAVLYVDEITSALYYIMVDNSRMPEEKAPFLLARLRAIPAFLQQRWYYQPFMDKIFLESAVEAAQKGTMLIEQAANYLLEALPDSARKINRYKSQAVSSLRDYGLYCKIEINDAPENHYIGKDQLNYLLRNIYFLDIDSDSLIKIGWHWYNQTTNAIDSLGKIIAQKQKNSPGSEMISDSLTKNDILNYYKWEIDQTIDFLRNNDIVTIPSEIGECIPVEMPEFLRHMRRGIAYKPPAPFSSDQTGYFFIRPIEELDSATLIKYNNLIRNRGFKGSVVHEAYPGHHLHFSISNKHTNPIRRIQGNLMTAEGWALYCEQMATEKGLFDDSKLDERWLDVYKGIRFRAVRIIVDCSLAENSMTPDSALVFMNSTLGKNTDYFTAEIRRYCSYPTTALCYLSGKLLILDMLDREREKEGNSFSLKKFHDKLLAEGLIPLPLIFEKLGYKK